MKDYKKKKLIKNLPYIELLLVFFIPILFITAHLLHTIYYLSDDAVWMGQNVSNIITDIVFYSAIFLSAILIVLILYREKKR